MSHIALTKITKINAQILELETEKKAMSEKLNQTLLTLISKSSVENVDFETRVGGLLFIQKTLQSNDVPDQKKKDIWKKEGALYLLARKKTTKQNISESSKEWVLSAQNEWRDACVLQKKKHSMTTRETGKISTIEAKLNRLKAKRAALTHQHKTETKRERMQRTRTLIQLGGLLSKVKLIDTFDINLGDDLQGDLECHDKAMTLLGLFVSVMDQLPETIDKSALKHKGINFMKTQK